MTILNLMKMAESSLKGNIAHYEQCLLVPQRFQKVYTADK